MWSDRFNYYNIQPDIHFSQKLPREKVLKALLETGCFKQEDHQSFRNADNFPWMTVIIVETKTGNFASSDKQDQFINLIAIVCSKGKDVDQQPYLDTFLQVAEKLQWKLYLEMDDDENEDVEIKRIV